MHHFFGRLLFLCLFVQNEQYSKYCVSCSLLLVLHGFGGVSEFKQVPSACGVAHVKCQLACVYTTCFRFVLRDHLGPNC